MAACWELGSGLASSATRLLEPPPAAKLLEDEACEDMLAASEIVAGSRKMRSCLQFMEERRDRMLYEAAMSPVSGMVSNLKQCS